MNAPLDAQTQREEEAMAEYEHILLIMICILNLIEILVYQGLRHKVNPFG